MLPALLIMLESISTAARATAQDPVTRTTPDANLDSVARRVETIDPKTGPPGTSVTIRTGGMPAVTPLRIGIGAVRFGFEEIGQVLTNEKGEFTITVNVPPWARRDLVHRFIVFDFYFNPIALSDLFHVTDSAGVLERAGEVTRPDGSCATLLSDDGLLYALQGDISTIAVGQRIVVEGTLVTTGCTSHTTIRILRTTTGNS